MKAPALMITCEHASNAVPDFVLRALRDSKIPDDILASHRAYDIGASALTTLARTKYFQIL